MADTALAEPETSRPGRRRSLLIAVATMTVGVLLALIAWGTSVSSAPDSTGAAPTASTAARETVDAPAVQEAEPQETGIGDPPSGYAFPDTSFWRQSVRDAPVNRDSDALVANLADSVATRYDGTATFNVRDYNASYYVVEPGLRTVDVAFDDCQNKGGTPSGLYDGAAHFADVPIPPDAEPAQGRDGALVVYSPSTDQLWELWRAAGSGDKWSACWGGRIDGVSTSPGYFDGNFGTTATGLPHAAGMISLADVRAGSIEHTVALLAAEPATYKTFSWPAQRSDGYSDDPSAVPEGLRLRLSADVDVASLGLHPLAEMVAYAAQEYGFVVVDKAGATGVYTESGTAEEAQTGVDPWADLLGDSPAYEVMTDFPWDKLEAMPMDYGKPADS